MSQEIDTFSGIRSLPVELLEEVTSWLAPADLVSLALTCKGLWSCGYQSALSKLRWGQAGWFEERIALLARLADDSSHMVLCVPCSRLYPTRPRYGPGRPTGKRCGHFDSYIRFCNHFKISCFDVEATLKNHKSESVWDEYHPALFHSCQWHSAGSDSAMFSQDIDSKVIAGEVYVRSHYSVEVRKDVKGVFNIPSMRRKGCLHAGLWLKKRASCSLRHASKSEAHCNQCGTAAACNFCDTHFKVFSERKQEKTFQLHILAYRRLGAGQCADIQARRIWFYQVNPRREEDVEKYVEKCHPTVPRNSLEYVYELSDCDKPGRPKARSFKSMNYGVKSIAFHRAFWRDSPLG